MAIKGLIAGTVGLVLVIWGAWDLTPQIKPKRFRRKDLTAPEDEGQPRTVEGPTQDMNPWDRRHDGSLGRR